MEKLAKNDEYIIKHVMTFINAVRSLNPDNLYKAEALCCEFWHHSNSKWHSSVGKRLIWLGKNDHLPIAPIMEASNGSMLFLIKPK